MDLPTLDNFIRDAGVRGPRNSYVRERGFSQLYVRHGNRVIGGYWYPTLDIARVEVHHPGKGTFKKLVLRLRKTYPLLAIYVESVLNPQFEDGLGRLGFKRKSASEPLSFYLLPDPVAPKEASL